MRFVYGVTHVVAGRKYLVYVAAQRLHAIAQYDALSQFWYYPGESCIGPGRVSAFWELDAATGVAPDREQAAAEPSRAFVGPNAALVLETPTAPVVRPSTGREVVGSAPPPMLVQQPPSPSRFTLLEVD